MAKTELITYKQDVLDIYNAIVKQKLRQGESIFSHEAIYHKNRYSPRYSVGLVEADDKLWFFNKTKKHGTRLSPVSKLHFSQVPRDSVPAILYPENFDIPIHTIPVVYTVYCEELNDLIKMNTFNIRRPNKKQLEEQVKSQ